MKLHKNYAIVLRIALSFVLITNGQTWADENIQTLQKELPAVKTEQPPTVQTKDQTESVEKTGFPFKTAIYF